MTFFRAAYTALLSLCMMSGALASQRDASIESFSLKNGMQVVLIPSHRIPAVTHMLFYRVGAGDDYPGRSGLAHYNEHMMFQGTKKVPSGEFARIISAAGGNMNAFTTSDYTAYYVTIARENLPLVMKLEADRMLNLDPTPENFGKEREVIIEERRMAVENKPEALLAEEMQAELFRNHPYHTPIIGWMSEMEQLSRSDVLDFHRRFYHPANALLVVAGDITRQELEPMAEEAYGYLPAGGKYVRDWRVEPPQRGPRHIVLHHVNVKQPQLLRYYMASSVGSGDREQAVPLYVLAQLMGGGTAGALYQSLVVKQKLATSVEVSYDGIEYGPGMLQLSAVPVAGVPLPRLEDAVDRAIAQALEQGFADQDVERAKVMLKAETIYARDSMENMARTLGVLMMSGLSADYFNRWPKLVDAVAAVDLRKAAQAFRPEASVTGYLLPGVPPENPLKKGGE